MKFAAKKNPTVLAGFFFHAKFHTNSLYVVEKKIVGISQYPYFTTTAPSRRVLLHLVMYVAMVLPNGSQLRPEVKLTHPKTS
jgi:hypothetical protein